MAVSDAAAAAPRRLERLQPRDAEGLCPLSIEAGWNQVAADWRLMLDLGWGYGVRGATPDDLQRICAYDRSRSGFARSPIVTHLLTRAPALARVAERADGTLAGYVLGRDGYRALHVGPVVAEDQATGLALLSSAF